MAAIADDGLQTEVTATFDAMEIFANKLRDVPLSAAENPQCGGSGPVERPDLLCSTSEFAKGDLPGPDAAILTTPPRRYPSVAVPISRYASSYDERLTACR